MNALDLRFSTVNDVVDFWLFFKYLKRKSVKMKRCVGGCGGTYMIRDGNLCRGCENRKKSQGQSIESMFERLSVSSSPKVFESDRATSVRKQS